MARSTRKPQTYQTSAAILALSSNDQFDLVMGSAGNASVTYKDADDSDVEITHTDLGLLVVGWDHEHNGYEIIKSFTPED
jgi:hypothetical protein